MASTTLRATVAQDEHPDELRRKLALLEGDRKAYYEGSQRAMRENKAQITQLRKENKTMAAKIKTLKVRHLRGERGRWRGRGRGRERERERREKRKRREKKAAFL